MAITIDPQTAFGARVAQRLAAERILWLVAVDPQVMPQPVPVWFYWDGQTFLIYSQPNTAKLRNIANNPQVALHMDGDGQGGDIVVVLGEAHLAPDTPAPHKVAEYATKYTAGFTRIGMTAETFSQVFSVALRVTPHKLRGH